VAAQEPDAVLPGPASLAADRALRKHQAALQKKRCAAGRGGKAGKEGGLVVRLPFWSAERERDRVERGATERQHPNRQGGGAADQSASGHPPNVHRRRLDEASNRTSAQPTAGERVSVGSNRGALVVLAWTTRQLMKSGRSNEKKKIRNQQGTPPKGVVQLRAAKGGRQ